MEQSNIQQILKNKRKALGLTQEQLSRKAEVAYTTLTKIESGYIKNPSSLVIQKISKALGITTDSILAPKVFQNQNAIKQIFEDVLSSVRQGEEMYLSGIDEKRYLKADKQGIQNFITQLKQMGISQKILSCEGDTHFLKGEHLEYRWIPATHFQSTPMYVYGTKIAFLVWEPLMQSVIIDNAVLAEAFKKQFLYIWGKAKPVARKAGRKI